MSQRNADLVRRAVEQLGLTDREAIGAYVAEFWDPDADYYPVRKFPEARPRHGCDEITSFLMSFTEGWDSFDFVPLTVEAVGDDHVLVRATIRALGRDTRLSLEGGIYQCVWLRNGRILRWEDHLTEAGAVHALGVSDESIEVTGPNE
jgi:SnoaL-like domain